MEQKENRECLSIQELGAVIDKISFRNDVLPRTSDHEDFKKDRIYQIKNPLLISDEAHLEKAKDNTLEEDFTLGSIHVGQVEFPASTAVRKVVWIPISSRKTVEKVVLALLVCVVSTAIVLPFFLLIGDSIQPWSPSVSYGYDESCDINTATANSTTMLVSYNTACSYIYSIN